VDGESQDNSGGVLDEISRKEPRLTVIHEGRIGPGRARNVGAERARGEYIWFVDGDDLVLADCLTLISERIQDIRPDVLFIGHESF
jgi:CDP-glycerol glycerophosphotransferase